MNLAQWQSHKRVRAGRISHVKQMPDGSVALTVETADGRSDVFTATQDMLARAEPEPGWYLVVYEDGYTSLSPAKAFEEGYTRIAA